MIRNILHLKTNSPFQISDSGTKLLDRVFPASLFLDFYIQIKEEHGLQEFWENFRVLAMAACTLPVFIARPLPVSFQ